MYEIRATIEGLVPMMHDRFFDQKDAAGKGKKVKGKDVWKDELALRCYQDEKGVFVPCDNVRMTIIGNKHRPGAAKILGSYIETKKATEYTNFAKGCLWVVPLEPNPKVQKLYIEPHRKQFDDYDERSFINAAGSRSLTRRPIITLPWSVAFKVQVTDNQFGPEKVREFFDVAGLRCGLGAYGPTFGRFIVTEWDLIEAEAKVKTKSTRKVG